MDLVWSTLDFVSGRLTLPKRTEAYAKRDAKGVYTNADFPELRHWPEEGADTVYAMMQYAIGTHGSRQAVGTRELIKSDMVDDGTGKKFEKLWLGEYSWLTYEQFGKTIDSAASGLAKFAGLKSKTKMVIYAETKADWQVAAQAAFRQGAVVVTIYATLGEEGVLHGLNETKAPVVVCDSKLFKTLSNVLPECKHVKHIVTIGDIPEDLAKKVPAGIDVKPLKELIDAGATEPVEATPPVASDLAVIMYTSGTTGPPKGVMITHANCCAATAGLLDAGRYNEQKLLKKTGHRNHGRKIGWPNKNDRFLAYLPLAHIMELVAEMAVYSVGGAVGYGHPQTLSDVGLKLAPGIRGDAIHLKPTFMVFPPTVLDRIRQGITAKVQAAGGVKAYLFEKALADGKRDFDAGRIGPPPLWNLAVFRTAQAALGGCVEVMITGSAPLSHETQSFIQTVFNCPVRQGYGLTETTCAATVGCFETNDWNVGRVLSSCKLKLKDWEEGNYRNSDLNDPSIGMARGEICIGGPCISMGYYMDPDEANPELEEKNRTDFSVDEDGTRWFHTGDIGQMTPMGLLQIIDRKKDLLKLQHGEYVALSKVENAMKLSPYVEQCMAYGKSSEACIVAAVVPNEKALRAWAETKGKGAASFTELCEDAEAVEEVAKSVAKAVKGKLVAFEIPAKVALSAEPWTPENDLVTAAMKLKRPNIVKALSAKLEGAYAEAKKK